MGEREVTQLLQEEGAKNQRLRETLDQTTQQLSEVQRNIHNREELMSECGRESSRLSEWQELLHERQRSVREEILLVKEQLRQQRSNSLCMEDFVKRVCGCRHSIDASQKTEAIRLLNAATKLRAMAF